jgi:aminoglycoside phosphotransferase (APT) family kinase protein
MARLRRLAGTAAAHRLDVAVEFQDLPAALASGAWAALREQCAGLIVDFAALDLLGAPLTLPGLDPSDVRWVHLADVERRSGTRPRRTLPGDGTLPLAEALSYWQSAGRLDGVSVEVLHCEDVWTGSLAGLVNTLDERIREVLAPPVHAGEQAAPECGRAVHQDSAQTWRCVASAFRGGAPASVARLTEGATGTALARVEHDGRSYVIRRLRPDASAARAESVCQVHRTAFDSGLPVPEPHSLRDGRYCLAYGGRLYTMSSFVSGEPFDFTQGAQLSTAADLLARWHVTMRPGTGHRDQPGLAACLADPVHMETRLDRVRPQVDTCGADLLAWARQLLLESLYPGFWKLPAVVCHGDFHGTNLLFDGSGSARLIDFDNTGMLPALYDVAYAVLMLCRTGRGDFVIDRARAIRFLTDYRDRAAVPAIPDPRLLVPAMVLTQLPEPDLLAALPAEDCRRQSLLNSQLLALRRIRAQQPALDALADAWCRGQR